MLLPTSALVRRLLPSKFMDADGNSIGNETDLAPAVREPFDLLKIVNGIALSMAICVLASLLVSWFDRPHMLILTITVLTLLVANLAKPLLKHIAFEFEIGMFFMFVFFAAIGAGANLTEVVGAALPATLFIITLVLVHLALLIPVGRLLKLDLAELMVASNACILGPPTAAALAASKGWRALVTPGVLVGILGYSIGTFIGVAIFQALA
jgi:uncharacterized membrane protein